MPKKLRPKQRSRSTSHEAPKNVRISLPLAIIVALSIAAYANAIGNSFVLDDVSLIVENPSVRTIDLRAIFTSPYWARGALHVADPTLYRPLTILSFATDHALWGANATAFHVVNLALHAAVIALVWALGLQLFGVVGAFVAASVFAVHPVHTESVTGIVGRADVLATLFSLLAFLVLRRRSAFAGGGTRAWLQSVFGAMLWFAGLLSKEMAATFPFLLALDDWLYHDERRGDQRLTVRSLVIRYAPLVAIASVYFILRQNAVSGPAHVWPGFLDVTSWERILTASRIVMEYLALFVVPHTLRADYWTTDVPIATSILQPLVLLSIVIWVATAALLITFGKRSPVLCLAVGWFFITLGPVSNVLFPIGVAKAERLLYLPSVGLCILTGYAATRIATVTSSSMSLRFALAAILGMLTWRTARRNREWKDSLTLASATLAVSPASPFMNDIVAGEYMRRGEAARALPLLQTAVREAPSLFFIHSHLGATYYTLGLPDDAIKAYREAIRLNPLDADALNNLGVLYLDRQQDDEAISAFSAAIAARPAFADAHLNLGTLHFARGRMQEAEASFTQAVLLNPASPEAHNNLGLTLARRGQLVRAGDHYREALRLNPGFVKARNNLSALEKGRDTVRRTP